MWSDFSECWAFPPRSQEAWLCPAIHNCGPKSHKSQMNIWTHGLLNSEQTGTAVQQIYPSLTAYTAQNQRHCGACEPPVALGGLSVVKCWAQSRNVCLSTMQIQLEL